MGEADRDTPAGASATPFGRSRAIAAALIVGLLAVTASAALIPARVSGFTWSLFETQDSWVAPLFVAACLLGARDGRPWQVGATAERRWAWLCVAMLVLVCWAGHDLVFQGFDTNRDERMVVFDAAIFREGALAGPIPAEWRDIANALNRKFMLPIGSAEYWVSAYLPVNAAFHALVGMVADDDLTSPLMVGAGAWFLWRIAGLLWPESASTRIAVLLFYAGSSQILITGMTKFAMSAHLALNLAWLWLFVRGGRSSNALAMLVGFLATGLHQPLFHPLFALPFFALLAARREWKLLTAYLAAYACMAGFWLGWPLYIASFGSGPVTPIGNFGEAGYGGRILALLKGVDLHGLWLTAANLLRFVAWQHLLLVPVALFGAMAAWRSEPLVRALAVGFVLPILVMWILLPWQGSGYGYRYLHPVLGNAILLAGWGWAALERQGKGIERPMAWASAASLLLLFPLHAAMAHGMVEPKVRLDRAIAGLDSEVALLDPQIYDDFVHNRHDLSNRPIRLFSADVPAGRLRALCRGRSLAFVDPPAPMRPSAKQQALKSAARAAGCAWKSVAVQPDGSLSRH